MCWNEQTQCLAQACRQLEKAKRAQSRAHCTPLPPIPDLLCSYICRLLSSSFWQVRPAGHPAASGLHRAWHSKPCPFTRHIIVALALKSKDHLPFVAVASRWQRRMTCPAVKLVFKAALTFLVSWSFLSILRKLSILLKIYLWPKRSTTTTKRFFRTTLKLSKGHGGFSPVFHWKPEGIK